MTYTFDRDYKKICKLIAQKEEKLSGLKSKLLEKYPEDACGIKWMNLYDEKSEKIKYEIKELEKKKYVCSEYMRAMNEGRI